MAKIHDGQGSNNRTYVLLYNIIFFDVFCVVVFFTDVMVVGEGLTVVFEAFIVGFEGFMGCEHFWSFLR